ncbi:MAG: Fis family transcriptional regulator [Myxococcales bacterium]|nr:Fis family transcriptional regulator [Myxococcales bacterium]
MKKHSAHASEFTQISYILNTTELRLSRFQLKVKTLGTQGQLNEKNHIFEDAPVRIGSLAKENHIVLSDETVSRKHCEIIREGDAYLLRDLDSTNGTFVNQVKVKEIFLSEGLEFQVGSSTLIFEPIQEEISIQPSPKNRFGRMIGQDVKMREIFTIIEKISHTDTTVVIEGETGTGKDVLAQSIHEHSRRAKKPFVVVDCSAIPEHLIESELFGHEKGSFTGAFITRKGLFEQANGGTIFLDELGELALDLQPKLLRVLETHKVRRVGGMAQTAVDVRVIAATNRKLEDEVKAGRFREDLFYRLSVVRIFLPPLRERMSDLRVLLEHFLRHASFNQVGPSKDLKLKTVNNEAFSLMSAHTWPGNVRELINVIERACTLAESSTLRPQDLPPHLQNLKSKLSNLAIAQAKSNADISVLDANSIEPAETIRKEEDTLNEKLSQPLTGHFFSEEETNETELEFEAFKVAKERWITLFEKDYILTALKRSKYNISHAAREAGIDRKYFRKLMHKYNIEVP